MKHLLLVESLKIIFAISISHPGNSHCCAGTHTETFHSQGLQCPHRHLQNSDAPVIHGFGLFCLVVSCSLRSPNVLGYELEMSLFHPTCDSKLLLWHHGVRNFLGTFDYLKSVPVIMLLSWPLKFKPAVE